MELGFFIKLSEIPDLASKLEDEDFNRQLREHPAQVFADHGISIPEELIPDEINLPSPGRIIEIKEAMALLSEGGDGEDELFWFPFIFRPLIPWFPGPWFWPWIRRPDSSA